MRAGKLRYAVTIQTPAPKKDNQGTTTNSWSIFAATRMSREQTAGQEANQSGEIAAWRNVTWKGRYLSGVTEQMRLKWTDAAAADHYYDIRSVMLDQFEKTLTIESVERTQ